MSTQSESDAIASTILFFQETVTNECTGFARITLLILDWILNFDREAQMFWNRPRSTAAVLYFTMRWTSLVNEGLALIAPSVTNSNAFPAKILNFAVASLVLVLSLVPLGANLVRSPIPRAVFIGITGDSYQLGYFRSVLFILDVLSILVSVLPVLDAALATSGPLHFVENMISFVQPLTSILIAHFLLDLQDASRRTLKLNSDDPLYSEASIGGSRQSSLNFARVVGSLGAVIDHRAFKEDLAEEVE
ncbi:hypothetical protein LXA43DRAFT_1082153 [Ganoderma leucocontextum]|nr:hypothetical protein LXA43DRAFT_1082153 [Ganoderma leucocontextum]